MDRWLGKSGLKVSRLCFGSLTLGPLQAGLPLEAGAALLRTAFEAGVNFVDTAQIYGTYPYIRKALRGFAGEVVIASKAYAYSAAQMAAAVEEARRELDRDVVEIFLLHEQESALTFAGHRAAWEYLLGLKQKGIIKAVGISTHAVAGVRAATADPDLDVVHPLINMAGLGIIDGTAAEMTTAIAAAYAAGKGIYGMKVLGGGNLFAQAPEALAWALDQPHLHAIAVGMQTERELAVNLAFFQSREVVPEVWQELKQRQRRLLIEEWCTGCGRCVTVCPQGALTVAGSRAVVTPGTCVLCGYCSRVCRDFCIKVV